MRSAIVFTLAIGLAAFCGCSRHSRNESSSRLAAREAPMTRSEEPASRKEPTRYDADNTARNARDRQAKTLTPLDQSEKASDLEVTQRIRKALVRDKTLSTNAKNVKIITIDGAVTLRGPVKDASEKQLIERTAIKVAGKHHVRDQLESAGS